MAPAPPLAPVVTRDESLSSGASTRREQQHIEVVRLVLSGERDRAAVLGREHLREFPDDVLVARLLTSYGLA